MYEHRFPNNVVYVYQSCCGTNRQYLRTTNELVSYFIILDVLYYVDVLYVPCNVYVTGYIDYMECTSKCM